MGQYESYPVDAGAQPPTEQPARPASVQRAVQVIWAKIALNVVGAVIGLLYLDSTVDDAVRNARASSPDVDADLVRTFAIVGAVVGLVISVALMSVLAVFIAKGANWARITYTVLVGLGIVTGLLSLAGGSVASSVDQPAAQVVVSVIGLVLSVVVLVLLWRRESSAWFTRRR